MAAPRYQELTVKSIPVVALDGDAGSVRVIAGEFGGAKGPARTFTPINLLDVRLKAGKSVRLNLKDGYTASLYVLRGKVLLNGLEAASETELVVLEGKGEEWRIGATWDATVFVMTGEPINEPVYGYGPFV